MKLVQLNIWMGRLLPQVINFIETEQPDILCMQEVYQSDNEVKFPDLMFDSLNLITETCGLEYVFFSPTFSMKISDTTASMGNAILSRYPLLNQQTIFTNGQFTPDFSAKSHVSNTRNMQYASVELPGRKLDLINHHAHRESNAIGSEISIEKMKIVADFAKQQATPLFLAGDLNVSAASPAMRVFDGFLEDLTATHNIASTLTELGKAKNVPCDHILVSSDIQVKSFSASEQLISDHKALIMEFSLES